jgi:hypothetical protein
MSSRKSTRHGRKLQAAYEAYVARQDRSQHPDGRCDSGGRWYPSESEQQACCRGIRSPSRSYPWSLMTHCRTLDHVAHLHGLDPAELRAYKLQQDRERRASAVYYKAVAVSEDGRLLSIFDGSTEYRIGETLQQRARREHGGGYYVYETPEQAAAASVPNNSALRTTPRAEGQFCRYDNGKLSFSRVTPLEIVPTPAAAPVSACA